MPADIVSTVRDIASRELSAAGSQTIDADGHYPENIMRGFGAAGAFAAHVPPKGTPDLATAIHAMSAAGEYCLSTSFCMWCQDALAWLHPRLRERCAERQPRRPRCFGRSTRRHRALEPDEDLLRDRADQIEGEARRGRLRGARAAAVRLQSRCRPLFRLRVRGGGRAQALRDGNRAVRERRPHPRRQYESLWHSTARAPSRCRCATS